MKKYLPLLTIGILVASLTPAHAAPAVSSLNINFGGDPAPSSTFGAAAGQVGVWNSITNLNEETSLRDLDGYATDATLNFRRALSGGSGGDAGDLRNLQDRFFYSTAASEFDFSWTFTISGLQNGIYDFYFYAPNHSNMSTGRVEANGMFHDNIGPFGSISELTEGVNWAKISGVVVNDGSLTVRSFEPGVDQYRGISGAQLVAVVPEPGTYVLMGLAAVALLVMPRMRRIAQDV